MIKKTVNEMIGIRKGERAKMNEKDRKKTKS